MTDERIDAVLLAVVRRLPPGTGIVFRHGAMPARARHRLFVTLRRIARARRLVIVARGAMPGADGRHGGGHGRGRGLRTAPAHSPGEAAKAAAAGAHLLFISPVFATRSHPGAPHLGTMRAAAIGARLPVVRIALGGMDAAAWRRMRARGLDGWAAIDAWGEARRDPRAA